MSFLCGIVFQRSVPVAPPVAAEAQRVVSACEKLIAGAPQCADIGAWGLVFLLVGLIGGWAGSHQWRARAVVRPLPSAAQAPLVASPTVAVAAIADGSAGAAHEERVVETYALDLDDSELENYSPRRRLRTKTRC